MAIKYYKLIDLLNRRGILKTKFAKDIGISPNTLAKLSNNDIVSLEVIDKACKYLDVQPGELLEYLDEFDNSKANVTVWKKFTSKYDIEIIRLNYWINNILYNSELNQYMLMCSLLKLINNFLISSICQKMKLRSLYLKCKKWNEAQILNLLTLLFQYLGNYNYQCSHIQLSSFIVTNKLIV